MRAIRKAIKIVDDIASFPLAVSRFSPGLFPLLLFFLCSTPALSERKRKATAQHGPRISTGPIIGSQQCVRYEQLHDCIAGSELPPRTVADRQVARSQPAASGARFHVRWARKQWRSRSRGGAGFWPDKCLRLSGRRPGRMLTCKLHRCPGPSGGA